MDQVSLSARIAEIALALGNSYGFDDVCCALESGQLQCNSTSPVRASIADGNSILETFIRELQALWAETTPFLSSNALATALRSSLSAEAICRRLTPRTQVVWTGPKVEGSFLRSTLEVVREILRNVQNNLLVIGYWIAAKDEGEGIIEEVIASLASAVQRKIALTIIVDERQRVDGRDNRKILLDAWPSGVSLPKILTWRLPPDDRHLKLHAKVLVADGLDALVTSANFTYYAMDRNMEMGIRVSGPPASAIYDHFHRLIESGIIEDYEQASDR